MGFAMDDKIYHGALSLLHILYRIAITHIIDSLIITKNTYYSVWGSCLTHGSACDVAALALPRRAVANARGMRRLGACHMARISAVFALPLRQNSARGGVAY